METQYWRMSYLKYSPNPYPPLFLCCSPFLYRLSCVFVVVADISYKIRSRDVSFSCSCLLLLCCLFVGFLSLFLCCSLVTFWGSFSFLCSWKYLRHPPGCFLFSRVPSFRLFPVCTLKISASLGLLGIFTRSFLPLLSCLDLSQR